MPAPINPVIQTRSLFGLRAIAVTVECHLGGGLPGTTIVGMAQGAVRESRDRVRAALQNTGFAYPRDKVIINLAPGQLTKSSSALDLPIALAILAKAHLIPTDYLDRHEFLGELGLFGELRKVPGGLTCALASHQQQRTLIVPKANAHDVAMAPSGSVKLAESLPEVVALLRGEDNQVAAPPAAIRTTPVVNTELADVLGQSAAKRAMLIAATGGHHLLMVGPPGTGKTMLASRLPALLPDLTTQQSIEVAAVYSAAGQTRSDHYRAPLRTPHHSASAAALIGGGNPPLPGEVALAHHGVLFLDELPHFKPAALNLLREPIESGRAIIARATYKVEFPCRFQLVAAMNPCPAGRTCSEQACRCSAAQVQRYQGRISGPLLDRIDIHVPVNALPENVLARMREDDDKGIRRQRPQESIAALRAAVTVARDVQIQRQGVLNCVLQEGLTEHIDAAAIDSEFLQRAIRRYKLSARSYAKLWRIARTIADLAQATTIEMPHLVEAMSYRALDWESGLK